MTTIKEDDFINSLHNALQFISYYHPIDYVRALTKAWEKEKSPIAKNAMAQILANSRMCAEEHRPICQDTGSVTIFLAIGMDVRWESDMTITKMVNKAVRQAYTDPNNILRASMVDDPLNKRRNTKDNTPAIIHTEIVAGDKVEIQVAAKGAGSENKACFSVLNPNNSVLNWVLQTVSKLGSGWCPPGLLGIGIGGSPEKAMILAKQASIENIDIDELIIRGPSNYKEELRLEIYQKVNALGIGAQGLGGITTILDVKIKDFPTHAASLPVALIPNCVANRHIKFTLDGLGPKVFKPPVSLKWPDISLSRIEQKAIIVNLDTITQEEISNWKLGEKLLLNGKLLTGRDAVHNRIQRLIRSNQPLPDNINFKNRFIYYVGPVDPIDNEIIGPAGPTTAMRMDNFTEMMLEKMHLIGMIGKAERSIAIQKLIKKYKVVYLIAIGGSALLLSKRIRSAHVIAFEDLGMEAIYEFEVKNLPVIVAVDTDGESIHEQGPNRWRQKIKKKSSDPTT